MPLPPLGMRWEKGGEIFSTKEDSDFPYWKQSGDGEKSYLQGRERGLGYLTPPPPALFLSIFIRNIDANVHVYFR